MRLRDWAGGQAANGAAAAQTVDARRKPRRKVRGAGVAAWVEPDGQCYSSPVEFKDASELGAGILMPMAVPAGQTIWLLLKGGADYRAVVRHCRETQRGFHIGVRTVPEKRTASKPEAACRMKWFDDWNNVRISAVSLVRDKSKKLTVMAGQKVPCPSIVLLATDEDLCLAHCASCGESAPYPLTVEILRETYVSY